MAVRHQFLILGALLLLAVSAHAQDFQFDTGLRLEQLSFDKGIEFSCQCDEEEDPGCTDDPDFCSEATLKSGYSGTLYGGFVGASVHGDYTRFGVRFAATIGGADRAKDESAGPASIGLFHITVEAPLEAHMRAGPLEFYCLVAPRAGFLNYNDDDSKDEESADTFTLGLMLSAGIRFGIDGWWAGGGAGYVANPSFGGPAYEVTLHENDK